MAKEPKNILDLLNAADEPLVLEGGIRNLLASDLRIVDGSGELRTIYARSGATASVRRDGGPGQQLQRVLQLQNVASWDTEVIGSFNYGFIDLVKPLVDTTELVQFWYDAVKSQHAVQHNLPDMKALRKQRGMDMYCVVRADVALVAYFRYDEIDRLLVPVRPVLMRGHTRGYQALMPAAGLLLNQPLRR